MIDLFSLALTHGLLCVMAIRLLSRDDLDRDPGRADGRRAHPGDRSGEGDGA